MSGESTGLHEASHYKFTRRVITPTFPVEGDYLKIETEEAIFGILFAYMGFWLLKQLRGVFAWYRESRALRRQSDPVGVTIDEGRRIRERGGLRARREGWQEGGLEDLGIF